MGVSDPAAASFALIFPLSRGRALRVYAGCARPITQSLRLVWAGERLEERQCPGLPDDGYSRSRLRWKPATIKDAFGRGDLVAVERGGTVADINEGNHTLRCFAFCYSTGELHSDAAGAHTGFGDNEGGVLSPIGEHLRGNGEGLPSDVFMEAASSGGEVAGLEFVELLREIVAGRVGGLGWRGLAQGGDLVRLHRESVGLGARIVKQCGRKGTCVCRKRLKDTGNGVW